MIYVLPGMGADSSMYRGEWRALENCTFLDWPDYRGETTLTAIAQRIVDGAGVRDGDAVVGHSLGGMVACEIARSRKLSRLILMGSATRKEEISSVLALLHPLADYTPFEFLQKAAARLPGELAEMFSRSQADFLRATCLAIFRWEGLDAGTAQPYRIHGKSDRVIPCPRQHVHCVLEGGHMIPVTHATDCVNFIRSLK